MMISSKILILVIFTILLHVAAALSTDEEQFLQAAFANRVEEVQATIDHVHPNVREPGSGQTALMGAVLRGHVAVVNYLLSRTDVVDVTVAEKDGYTPAHGAGFQGRAEIMKALHAAGVDVVNDFHSDGYAPLHRACWGREQRHTDTIRVLRDDVGVDVVNLAARSGKRCGDMTSNAATLELLKMSREEL